MLQSIVAHCVKAEIQRNDKLVPPYELDECVSAIHSSVSAVADAQLELVYMNFGEALHEIALAKNADQSLVWPPLSAEHVTAWRQITLELNSQTFDEERHNINTVAMITRCLTLGISPWALPWT